MTSHEQETVEMGTTLRIIRSLPYRLHRSCIVPFKGNVRSRDPEEDLLLILHQIETWIDQGWKQITITKEEANNETES